ncbi:hypothetical protein EJ07DRAFT_171021 [Lizonia empirigonia]|nr:hypothetical protein EJ07DRAFT_171021 [Lizonia empirigonia]
MQFFAAAIAASAAALVSASPCATTTTDTEIKAGDVFRIMTIRSGSPIQYASVQAANNGFYVGTAMQNATCTKDVNYASFRLTEAGELFLYNNQTSQQAYVDRSGMGQGVFQYTTGDKSAGSKSERTGFALDESNNLVFSNDKTGFQACPGAAPSGYSVWLGNSTTAGGNTDCLPFIARAMKEDPAISCSYTT